MITYSIIDKEDFMISFFVESQGAIARIDITKKHDSSQVYSSESDYAQSFFNRYPAKADDELLSRYNTKLIAVLFEDCYLANN